MNILLPDSWLHEYLKTKATAKQIANYLSLCSQSVEKTTRIGADNIYEIEVTTNRPDCLSVYGLARELNAILPHFGIKAKLEEIKETKNSFPQLKNPLPLKVRIKNQKLCPRFTAIIFDHISFKPSPELVKERLEKSGIRALNNVVDISNYLMLELGQPMHTFDYDKIKDSLIILRESAGGEKLTTLDGQIRPLPEGTIIIEDGQGRIIDLCGIMGGENSAVDKKTKRVLLFVQTYDPIKIRRTCQLLGFRTEAAQRFEKGVDSEGVILSMKKAIAMFEKNCQARVASNLIDIYPHSPKRKRVSLTSEKLNLMMGIKLDLNKAREILESLGFKTALDTQRQILNASVPHWRNNDISISEDLVEEIARIYGYHRLPNVLPDGQIPIQFKNPLFYWEDLVKTALNFWGFMETVSYSMISLEMLQIIKFNPDECLKISNPLVEDLVYLRPSLIPSIMEVIKNNQLEENYRIKIFELANIYMPQSKDKLPQEVPILTAAIAGNKFLQLKGILEAIFCQLGIDNFHFDPYDLKKTTWGKIFHPNRVGEVVVGKNSLGVIGEINPAILANFGIKGKVVVFDLDFVGLSKQATSLKKYVPIPKFPAIIEDLAFVLTEKIMVGNLIRSIKNISPIIKNVSLYDSFKNIKTFKIVFQSQTKTLSDKEVGKLRIKIIKDLKERFGAELKQKE